MLGLFKQAKASPSPTDTLKRLREVLDTLEKREAFLGTRVNAERERAKKLATSNKKGTLSSAFPFSPSLSLCVAGPARVLRAVRGSVAFVHKRETPTPSILPSMAV